LPVHTLDASERTGQLLIVDGEQDDWQPLDPMFS
jgi:hypothetical protein